jgi:DegV family protein with EDD domain
MRKVGIVTDTTACIPQEKVQEYGIEVVPVQLIFENNTYRDGIDISPSEFYALLRKAKKLPTTSSSSPGPYLEAFRRASQRTDSILCLTEPVKFSAMHNAATIARDMIKNELPRLNVEVIACDTAAAGMGLVALAAARAAHAGKDLSRVIEVTNSIMPRVNLFAALDTLHYLAKGGRVPQAAELVNSLFQIKPIFSLNHADARTVALPRTSASALKKIVSLMQEKVASGQHLHVAVMHANAPDKALQLKNRIASQFNCVELFITEFTPVMGVHTGPGLVGVAFYGEQQ